MFSPLRREAGSWNLTHLQAVQYEASGIDGRLRLR